MLRDIKWPKNRTYKSDSDWEPLQFYLDALRVSRTLDLHLGYFSSAAISVLSLGFARFLSNGGSMRLVINEILSAADKDVVKRVADGHLYQIPFDLNDFAELKSRLDDYDLHFFQCLGWLIQNGRIGIVMIRPLHKRGIAHYKSGTFSDGKEQVGFSGSCNFTAYGLLENLERIDITNSWDGEAAQDKLAAEAEDFDHIYGGKAAHVEYLDAEQITTAIATTFGKTDIDELLVREAELQERKKEMLRNRKMAGLVKAVAEKIETDLEAPRFPYPQGPRPYQQEAHRNWLDNGRKGLFAMATGTGKTLTSLNCLLNNWQESRTARAVILVPTIALVGQWKSECEKFNFNNLITVSSRERWEEQITFFNTAARFTSASFIIIATYASFQKKKFQGYFQRLPADTLLIADEVHNMGSPSMLRLLPKIHLQQRIGLSATPSRKFDMVGNQAIEQFFHSAPPYTYSYSMKKALQSGWLCAYTYYPHLVTLLPEELAQYLVYSRQLLQYFDPVTNSYGDSKEAEFLLLARKRIIHKAANKKAVFKKILEKEFGERGNLNYTLVYVPEGVEADYDKDDHDIDSDEEVSLIDEYTRTVSRTDASVMVRKYTSQTPDRNAVIQDFERGKIHVLTSMKCLDEGVDVPRSELAIFCASTGNPRQFIQRRGRVLRKHDDKVHAVIHDLVVVPQITDGEETYTMERSIVGKELERVVDFADLSLNGSDTYTELKPVLDHYNLNLHDFSTNIED